LQDSGDQFAEGHTAKPNSSQSAQSKPSSSQSKPSGKITPKMEEISSYLKEVLLTDTSLVNVLGDICFLYVSMVSCKVKLNTFHELCRGVHDKEEVGSKTGH
jgi:hypothetical protein